MTHGENKARQWARGAKLGLVDRTQETFAGTPAGVARACFVKRRGEHDRWDAGASLAFRGTTQRSDSLRDGEEVRICIAADREIRDRPTPPPDAPRTVRSLYTRRSDVAVP